MGVALGGPTATKIVVIVVVLALETWAEKLLLLQLLRPAGGTRVRGTWSQTRATLFYGCRTAIHIVAHYGWGSSVLLLEAWRADIHCAGAFFIGAPILIIACANGKSALDVGSCGLQDIAGWCNIGVARVGSVTACVSVIWHAHETKAMKSSYSSLWRVAFWTREGDASAFLGTTDVVVGVGAILIFTQDIGGVVPVLEA